MAASASSFGGVGVDPRRPGRQEAGPAVVGLGGQQELLDQHPQAARLAVGHLQQLLALPGVDARPGRQQPHRPDHGGERGAELVGDHGQQIVLHLVGLLEHLLLLGPQPGLPPGRGLGVLAGQHRPALAAQQQVGGEHRAEREQQQGRALGRQHQHQHADLGHDDDQQHVAQEPAEADHRPDGAVQGQVHTEQGHLDDDEHGRPGQDRRQGRAAGDLAAGQGRQTSTPAARPIMWVPLLKATLEKGLR